MFQRRIPDWLRHAPTPSIRGFAVLAGVESAARGVLMSVFPIVMYRTFGSAETVSEVYFLVGILSFITALLTPWLSRYVPRRWLFTTGAVGLILGSTCAATGHFWLVPAGLAANTVATVIIAVCFNSYVMDYIARSSLGESETLRLFYSGAAWTIGPYLGIWLLEQWAPAPFVVSGLAALTLLIVFWVMRLGNGKVIRKALAPTPNPLAFLPRFLAQPRLISGWSFAVLRSCGWWVYVVYLPIYAVENGLSEQLGGMVLSISNGFLFITPFMLRWMRKTNVRHAVQVGFYGSGAAFLTAVAFASMPEAAIAFLMLGAFFLVILDMSGGLPFLMAVKPSERTEMSAIFATYRDVSGVVTPGIARLVLIVAPLPGVFAATAVGLAIGALIATRLHPRLGALRHEPAKAPTA
ncbi:MFS transporter [Pelagibius sp. Alg239-R121]|uniref:MFS transporter n=1 Tax=Pelagibius sp. Alg239-R121 TaxID=2993448 RepID=UPI0024A66643|nr:MFS transporter [Pelagibius sp. Alg239-R121]